MEVVEELAGRVPLPLLIVAFLLVLAFGQAGLVQWLTRRRDQKRRQSSDERIAERERLSEDQNNLISDLQGQVGRERDFRVQDTNYYQDQIRRLRDILVERDTTITKLVETATSSERGNSRLRHALNNAFQHIASMRYMMRRKHIDPPHYEGWRDMLGISDDLDKKLRELFDDNQNNGNE